MPWCHTHLGSTSGWRSLLVGRLPLLRFSEKPECQMKLNREAKETNMPLNAIVLGHKAWLANRSASLDAGVRSNPNSLNIVF
jgi:hypothetical protein